MALPYGVDASVLVRLVAREPKGEFERCLRRLVALMEEQGCELFASNQTIGEAYTALMHHYGITSADTRAGLRDALTSGLVAPLNGRAVIEALEASSGPGLFDRLIANDYSRANLQVLTLDRRMASLPDVRLL